MRVCRTALCALTAVLTILPALAAAQATAAPPHFDAVSIRPTDPHARAPYSTGVNLYPGGRLVLYAVTLKNMVTIAYNLSYWQVSGGEPWTTQDTYTVEAVPPADAAAKGITLRHTWYSIQDPQRRAMLQTLLADRFQLRVRQETRTGLVYWLQRNGKPLQLHPLAPATAEPAHGNDGIGTVGYASGKWGLTCDMPQLAWFASSFILHAPVIDKTALQGEFHYRQPDADPDPEYSGGPGNSASFIRFLSQAGLKLVRAQGLVATLTILHADKPNPD